MLNSDQMYYAQKDMVEERRDLILTLRFGKDFLAFAKQQIAGWEAEQAAPPPPSPTEIKPLRSAHLGVGKAIRSTLSTFSLPEVATPAQIAAAERLHEAFFGGPSGGTTKAIDRATQVVKLDSRRDAIAGDMALFEATPLPTLVEQWFETGFALGAALQMPAPATAESSRRLELLNEGRRGFSALREGIRAEVMFRPNLPRDLEFQIMQFHDSMLESRGRRTPEPEAPEAPEVEPVSVDNAPNTPVAHPTILAAVAEG